MEGLLGRQQVTAESIHKIVTNISKDPASRKTADYIAKRLAALTDLFNEFEANNQQLQNAEDKSHEYFTTDAYRRVKQQYQATCEKLRSLQPTQTEDNGGFSKTDELLSLQRTNFRALSRVIRNIDIKELTETWELQDKLQILQQRWRTIDELHWQIDNLLIGSNLDYEQEFAKYEDTYETTKRDLNRKLNSVTSKYNSTPHIEIPTFSGDYTQWPTFMDLYTEAIHNNPSLTKSQKMQHLKGKLKGEAERLVQHLYISTENYDTCWDIITHRYNNTQLLFTKQIQIFMNQPPIQQLCSSEVKRLHDTSMETVHAIHNLGVDTSTWDPILVHILTEKMDTDTYAAYMEARKDPRALPSYEELMAILESKFTALEPLNKKTKPPSVPKSPPYHKEFSSKSLAGGSKFKPSPKTYHTYAERSCPFCKDDHILLHCKSFQEMKDETKMRTISQLNICVNCLYCHVDKQCMSRKRCRVCSKLHHTSLHDAVSDTQSELGQSGSSTLHSTNHVAGRFEEVLLSTVELQIQAADGTFMQMRCLLDQGSQTNLITESAAQRLGLPRRKQSSTISGIGISTNKSKGIVQLVCSSLDSRHTFTAEALVMTKMLSDLPNNTFKKQDWPHLQNIQLADPDYNISRPVDLLLDAGVYAEIVMDGILRGPVHAPIAQQTKMGWILMGNVKTFNCHAIINNIEEIAQYWEMEELTSNMDHSSPEEDYCEKIYHTTTERRSDGRYVVKIPMKPKLEEKLGTSKSKAVAQLERRVTTNNVLSESYRNFIDEYLKLGHMKRCTIVREPSCVLPHHGVLKLAFVANRVQQIVDVMPANTWKHVTSCDNAADSASSGLRPSQLLAKSLWWEGPTWLKSSRMPEQPDLIEITQEKKKSTQINVALKTIPLVDDLLTRHSSVTRIIRVLSWILRYISNCSNKHNKMQSLYLTSNEIEHAHNALITTVQSKHFCEEITQLHRGNHINSKSSLLTLNPTLDNGGILRVGGRLQNSNCRHGLKHPIILPSHDKLTELLIHQAHLLTLHGGAQLTLTYLRNKYWILGGLRTVKRQLRQCVRCHRFKKADNHQIMADLPRPRVTQSRPFSHTGVDFTGQVEVKANKGRGIKTLKAYIAVFICLATKAIHLELVSDLSSAAFIAALKRLCARRGTPKHMYSDNGTNFVGAAKTLLLEHRKALKYYTGTEFMDYIAELGIEWHFNAPAWPTAGGLWEAAVKSTKHHLRRVLGEQKLTFEEFSTLLTQIEACLNSRPLVPLTNDIENLDCLTPGHFLIGTSTLAPPAASDMDKRSITTRWQLTEKMHRDFWKSWAADYLQTLNNRGRWHHPTPNLEINELVLIKEDNAPPAKWLMGRVTDTHPGRDGHVRVVSLKTKNGTLKRPVTKLSRLPIATD